MRVIICGAGHVGYSVASYLSRENNDITVIDIDSERIQKITETLDANGIVGHASNPDCLEQAGANEADMIIAVTRSDEVNMVACQVAHSLFSIPRKIARIRQRSYLDPAWANLFSRAHMPIDVIISPEKEIAKAICRSMEVPGTTNVIPLAEGKVYLVGLLCGRECPVVNTPLRQLTKLFPDLDIELVSIIRGNKAILPDGDDQVMEGDEVFFCVSTEHIKRSLAAFGKQEAPARRIVIVGGGKIGYSLINMLSENPNISIKVIEKSEARAAELSESLDDVIVLHGEGMDKAILEEADIDKVETLIAVTNDDEGNILGSLLAKQFGCERVITLINNNVYTPLINRLEIDTAISPQAITVSSIMQHIRRGRIKSLHNLKDGFAEVIEIEASGSSVVVNIPLHKLNMPKTIIIGAIVRDDEVIIPRPETVIKTGDRVILLVTRGHAAKVEKLFSAQVDLV